MAVCPAFTVAEVEPPRAAPMEKSSGFIVSVSAAEVLGVKLASPEYFAVIEWFPTVKEGGLSVACAVASSVAVAICVVPSKNVTVPVGTPLPMFGLTVAVNVTDCPKEAGFEEDVSAVEVAA